MMSGPPPPPPSAPASVKKSIISVAAPATHFDFSKVKLKHTEIEKDASKPKKQGAIVDARKQIAKDTSALKPRTVAPDQRCSVHRISAEDLYNLIQDTGITKKLVDCRPADQFSLGWAKTAVNVPFVEAGDRDSSIDSWLNASPVNLRGLTYTKLVVYGDSGDGDGPFMRQCTERLSAESGRGLTDVYWLACPFAEFHKAYPFMVSTKEQPAPKFDYPTQILPRLFLGNYKHASDRDCLRHLGITHIVNMADELQNQFENDGIVYFNGNADDISSQNLRDTFPALLSFFDQSLDGNPDNKLFCHCALGISRAPSAVILYLMTKNNWTLAQALEEVKRRRSIVCPNPGFMDQLKEMENERGQ